MQQRVHACGQRQLRQGREHATHAYADVVVHARICQSGRRPVRGQVSNSQQYALLPASIRKIAVNVRRGGPAASRPAVRVSVQCSAVRSRGAVGDARMVHRSSIVPFGCQKSSNRVSFSPHSDAGHVGLGVPNDGELWW